MWAPPRSACRAGSIPNFDGDYYIEVAKAVKDAAPDIHVHGFTALEVTEGARRLGEPLASYLRRLMDAGLRSLPGTAAEILDDEIRATLCPDKINTEQWLEAHRTAHSVGLRSNITIMFGSIEQPVHWARHIVRTRDLQKETGGFTEFVGLPFVHMAAPIYLQRKSRRGPTWREVVLMHAVARIAYRRPHRQHPGVVGEAGRRRRPPAADGRRQRSGRHPHQREHLPRRRRQPRSGPRRGGVPRHRGAAGAEPGPAHHPLRAGWGRRGLSASPGPSGRRPAGVRGAGLGGPAGPSHLRVRFCSSRRPKNRTRGARIARQV